MKLKIRLTSLLLLFCFIWSLSIRSQTIVEHDFHSQRRQLAFYNIGLGSLIGGVGALINKSKEEKWHRVLLRGMGRGALGGYLNFEAKRFARLIPKTERVEYAWGSRLIHSMGSSIVENAAANRQIWARWKYDFGPLRIELDKRNRYRPRVRVQVAALYGNIFIATKGRLHLNYTLRSGGMVFTSKDRIQLGNRTFGGLANTTAFVIHENSYAFWELFTHEMLHNLQYGDYAGINRFLNPLATRWKNKYPLMSKASKWIHFDGHYFIQSGLYGLEKRWFQPCYYNNFFEMEVEHFATHSGVSTCQ